MTDWLLILGGLVTLIVGAEILVRGAVWIALALGVSKLTVGLTIVAFGTSAPELVVSIVDVVKPDDAGPIGAIALGNVFGSNIANIGLILGLTALVRAVPITEATHWMVAASILCMKPLVLDGCYTPLDGVVLVLLLALFTAMLLHRERRNANNRRNSQGDPDLPVGRDARRIIVHAVLVVLGLVGLFQGGQWLVWGSQGIAGVLGMPESLIGATIVAVGTSLPELATSVVAARRGHPEIAVGNVVGSNIFNICMVLGICALVRPLPVVLAEHGLRMSVGLLLAVVLGTLLLRRTRISRRAGGALLVCYLAYLTAEVSRL